jgi:hypothetical protein
MGALALSAAVFVVLWAILVIVAQALNPEQSPLSMGMSGLARGRAPWVIKASFVARGLSALLLVGALPVAIASGALSIAGLVLVWLWGVGSAALALTDTDMPGEPPTRAGAAHALVALAAYVAGVAGAILLSLALGNEDATAGAGRWALPIALAAAVALVAQFAGFGAAARQARSAAAGLSGEAVDPDVHPAVGGFAAASRGSVVAAAAGPGVGAAVPPPLAVARDTGSRDRRSAPPAAVRGLAACAGLLQRIFVGLLMLWTLVVALGI